MRTALGVSAALLVLPVAAQTVPDAGSLLPQWPRAAAPQPAATPLKSLPDPTSTAPSASTARLTVVGFDFEGAKLLSNAELQAIVARWVGRTVGVVDLQQAAIAVAQGYRDRGRLAQVSLPAQDVTSGRVRLRIDEARAGAAVIAGRTDRVPTGLIESLVRAGLVTDQPLDLLALERGLLLAQDVPGVVVTGSLQAGRQPGQTDLRLDVEPGASWHGQFRVDNAGARATGVTQVEGSLWLPNLLGMGDEAGANLSASEGLTQGGVRLNLPLGRAGTRAEAQLGASRYRLVSSDFAATGGRGHSTSVALMARHPVFRQRDVTMHGWAGLQLRRLHNEAAGTVVSDYRTQAFNLGVDGRATDTLLGGGLSSGSAVLTLGRVRLDGSPNAQADAVTARTGGQYAKLRAQLARTQVLSEGMSLQLALSGQWANRNLDSSEKFSLGGPYGVRAYPVGEAAGSSAVFGSIELRGRLPQAMDMAEWPVQWQAFFDAGQSRAHVDTAFAGAQVPNEVRLKGAGVGVRAALAHGFELHATLARRIGDNPRPTATGADQDGSLRRWRLWLSASVSF